MSKTNKINHIFEEILKVHKLTAHPKIWAEDTSIKFFNHSKKEHKLSIEQEENPLMRSFGEISWGYGDGQEDKRKEKETSNKIVTGLEGSSLFEINKTDKQNKKTT